MPRSAVYSHNNPRWLTWILLLMASAFCCAEGRHHDAKAGRLHKRSDDPVPLYGPSSRATQSDVTYKTPTKWIEGVALVAGNRLAQRQRENGIIETDLTRFDGSVGTWFYNPRYEVDRPEAAWYDAFADAAEDLITSEWDSVQSGAAAAKRTARLLNAVFKKGGSSSYSDCYVSESSVNPYSRAFDGPLLAWNGTQILVVVADTPPQYTFVGKVNTTLSNKIEDIAGITLGVSWLTPSTGVQTDTLWTDWQKGMCTQLLYVG